MMIYYYKKKDEKIVYIKVEFTTEENKLKIPKSIITTDGIYDSTVKGKELTYLKSISYKIVKDGKGKEQLMSLEKLLSKVTCRIHTLSEEYNEYIKNRGVFQQYKDRFSIIANVNNLFITELANELLELDYTNETIVLDLDSYYKSKYNIDSFIDVKQLFFFRDMPVGRYYSYRNKETIAKKDSLDVDVAKSRIVLGKNSSTNVYTIYRTKPIKEVDELYKQWRDNLEYDLYGIMLVDNMLKSKNIHYRDRLIFREAPRRLDSPSGDTLISEIKPAGLGYYGFQTFNMLEEIIDDFLYTPKVDNEVHTQTAVQQSAIDITDMIYSDGDVKLSNGFHIDYKHKINGKEFMIKLISGLDLPDRNYLKRIIKRNVTIYLIPLNIDNVACRHYVIMTVDDDIMLITNHPANLTLLK